MGGSRIATLLAWWLNTPCHIWWPPLPLPLDDWRPTSDIIDWQIVREESIELNWSLRMEILSTHWSTSTEASSNAMERLLLQEQLSVTITPWLFSVWLFAYFQHPATLAGPRLDKNWLGKLITPAELWACSQIQVTIENILSYFVKMFNLAYFLNSLS